MKNIAITSATKFISPITTKKKAIKQEIKDAFIGSIVPFLFFDNQVLSVSVGNILSTPNAWRVLGATITESKAEEMAAQPNPIGIIGPQIAMRLMINWSDARSSKEADNTSLRATATYIIIPTAVASRVPFGIEVFGSFKSPDKPKPAAIPVKAGKIIVKT